MTPDTFTLEDVDRDGAIRETADAVAGDTRADLLRKAAIASGGLVGGAAVLALRPEIAGAQGAGDIAILNFALTLEELEAAFYADALAHAGLTGGPLELAQVAGTHEAAHVVTLRKVLGSAAIARPTFSFGSATTSSAAFLRTAVLLEDTGVAAYKGQAPAIKNGAVLRAALAIHSVEARHAGWARFLAPDADPVIAPVDAPLTRAQVLSAVRRTGFIQG
jgi:hypothetical protein